MSEKLSERKYHYECLNDFDHPAFIDACRKVENEINDITDKRYNYDYLTASELQQYIIHKNEIDIYNSWDQKSVYVDSDVELKCFSKAS